MLVFANRAINGDGTDVEHYQDELGFGQTSEFRVLDVSNSGAVNPLGTSSNQDFKVARDAISNLQLGNKNLLVYIHGYNNTLKDSVDRCLDLEKEYGVQTISMTWPAKLGPLNQSNARASVANARKSKEAFRAMLAILARTLKTSNKVTLAVHSQGCDLYQKLIESNRGRLTHDRFFENILLLAPHARLDGHRLWVTKIKPKNKIFITINQSDLVLRGARQIAGMTYKRLGLAKDSGLIKNVPKVEYVDFDPHSSIFTEHSYFIKNLGRFKETKPFFKAAFNGRDAGKEIFDPNNRIKRSYLWYIKRINGVHFPSSLL